MPLDEKLMFLGLCPESKAATQGPCCDPFTANAAIVEFPVSGELCSRNRSPRLRKSLTETRFGAFCLYIYRLDINSAGIWHMNYLERDKGQNQQEVREENTQCDLYKAAQTKQSNVTWERDRRSARKKLYSGRGARRLYVPGTVIGRIFRAQIAL